jgi:signal transduction histidine kinase
VTGTVEQDLKTRLAQHRALASAPASEHAWLVEHGTVRTYAAGKVITARGQPAENLFVVLSGQLAARVYRDTTWHKMMEWRGGDVGGVLPYSRITSPPGDVVAEEDAELLAVPRALLPEMIQTCPVITATLVHAMVDRARQFTSSELRDEKLISLGKLASGVAHELNNPASAVARSAKILTGGIQAAEDAAKRLGAARLSEQQLVAIEKLRAMCAAPTGSLSVVARADREDAFADWLATHGVSPDCAAPLTETGITLAALDGLAASVTGEALDAALRSVAAGCQVRTLSKEIETAASRIYDLVAAVKGFSYMDHAPTPEPVDIRRGIADTLTVLGGKIRAKSVAVSVELPEDLPPAYAVGAELNQVWMNLIDNAIDAVPAGGHITVSAAPGFDFVSIKITDDGSGIPKEIQSRIFDPFFTTKGVGKGSGLGLDIVRRLIERAAGEVSVDSAPGRTEFQVRVPTEKKAAQ